MPANVWLTNIDLCIARLQQLGIMPYITSILILQSCFPYKIEWQSFMLIFFPFQMLFREYITLWREHSQSNGEVTRSFLHRLQVHSRKIRW